MRPCSQMMMEALAVQWAPRSTNCFENRNVKAQSLTVMLFTSHVRLSTLTAMKKSFGMQRFSHTSNHPNHVNKGRSNTSIGLLQSWLQLSLMKMFIHFDLMWTLLGLLRVSDVAMPSPITMHPMKRSNCGSTPLDLNPPLQKSKRLVDLLEGS